MNRPGTTAVPLADRRGLAAALGAFAIWGVLPLYLKLLTAAPVLQIMAHRVAWCCLVVFAWLGLRGEIGQVWRALRDARMRPWLIGSAALISVNWALYVWAVGASQVVEASLGYFINPLVSVLLGVFLLAERLNPRQWAAVGAAALGVLWLTWQIGRPPWIALALALSFGLYGFVRKKVAVDSVAGLGVETVLVLPAAIGWLLFEALRGAAAFGHHGLGLDLLLAASGLVTAIPLVLFAYGVRRVPLSTIGLMQYIAPTLQLLTAVLIFGEAFTGVQAIGFGLIWAALLLYAADGLWRGRMAARAVTPAVVG